MQERKLQLSFFNEETGETEEIFTHKGFEKRLFSETTNNILCKTFLENALINPITGEIGKTIIFCVSQIHATKITQTLNVMADKLFPDKYNSDFAVQVTSSVQNA